MIVESYDDVVVLTGALRSNYWGTISTAISLTLKRHPTGVIIDCSGITEATPDGIETFHDAIDFVKEHEDARIIVAGVTPAVLEVMRSVPEVRSQLAIVGSVEEARRSLDLLVEDHDDKKKRKEPVKSYDKTILACLGADDMDAYVLEVMSDLVRTSTLKTNILLPVLVPRDLPIQAPMPELEARVLASAELAKARLSQEGFPHEIRLERARDLGTLVQEVAEETDAAHVVVSIPGDDRDQEEAMALIRSVMAKVKRNLIFVRGSDWKR